MDDLSRLIDGMGRLTDWYQREHVELVNRIDVLETAMQQIADEAEFEGGYFAAEIARKAMKEE
jgi:predicted oxidoreductase